MLALPDLNSLPIELKKVIGMQPREAVLMKTGYLCISNSLSVWKFCQTWPLHFVRPERVLVLGPYWT